LKERLTAERAENAEIREERNNGIVEGWNKG
jgi:hypothetical protein